MGFEKIIFGLTVPDEEKDFHTQTKPSTSSAVSRRTVNRVIRFKKTRSSV